MPESINPVRNNINSSRSPKNGKISNRVKNQKEIKKITKQIVEKYKPEKIILFGSFVYGKIKPSSDVDLFIIKKSNLPRRFRTTKVERLLGSTPFPVDILVYTPKEIEKRKALGDFFIRNIFKKGKVLYAR